MFASFRHGPCRTVLLSATLDSAAHMNSLAVRNSTHHSYRRAGATLHPTYKSGGKSKQYFAGAGWRRQFYTHVQCRARVKV